MVKFEKVLVDVKLNFNPDSEKEKFFGHQESYDFLLEDLYGYFFVDVLILSSKNESLYFSVEDSDEIELNIYGKGFSYIDVKAELYKKDEKYIYLKIK